MKNLVVDIGNSRTKIAVMYGDDILRESYSLEDVEGMVREYCVERAIVCSTRGDAEEVAERLRDVVERVVVFGAHTPLPIGNRYSTPDTLGRDRLAAAVGSLALYEGDYHLIVDMGTAITIDLVSRVSGFEGGVIAAGVSMRFRALHEFTAALPLCEATVCEATDDEVAVARSTREAIEQGVMEGVKFEIEGQIEKMRRQYGEIVVIFIGGDAKKFVNRIKNTIFAERELVFVGLNRILEYNAE